MTFLNEPWFGCLCWCICMYTSELISKAMPANTKSNANYFKVKWWKRMLKRNSSHTSECYFFSNWKENGIDFWTESLLPLETQHTLHNPTWDLGRLNRLTLPPVDVSESPCPPTITATACHLHNTVTEEGQYVYSQTTEDCKDRFMADIIYVSGFLSKKGNNPI